MQEQYCGDCIPLKDEGYHRCTRGASWELDLYWCPCSIIGSVRNILSESLSDIKFIYHTPISPNYNVVAADLIFHFSPFACNRNSKKVSIYYDAASGQFSVTKGVLDTKNAGAQRRQPEFSKSKNHPQIFSLLRLATLHLHQSPREKNFDKE
jgi:hypothetical protein